MSPSHPCYRFSPDLDQSDLTVPVRQPAVRHPIAAPTFPTPGAASRPPSGWSNDRLTPTPDSVTLRLRMLPCARRHTCLIIFL
jgi:hypothetical protein